MKIVTNNKNITKEDLKEIKRLVDQTKLIADTQDISEDYVTDRYTTRSQDILVTEFFTTQKEFLDHLQDNYTLLVTYGTRQRVGEHATVYKEFKDPDTGEVSILWFDDAIVQLGWSMYDTQGYFELMNYFTGEYVLGFDADTYIKYKHINILD